MIKVGYISFPPLTKYGYPIYLHEEAKKLVLEGEFIVGSDGATKENWELILRNIFSEKFEIRSC
jgi:hypothetical protein